MNEIGKAAEQAPTVVIVPVPEGFAHEEDLQEVAGLAARLLASGMPKWELCKRLMRYHPAQEGV